MSDGTWGYEERPCLYVGNPQAWKLGEVEPNDSVIEGNYRYYKVDSVFSLSFIDLLKLMKTTAWVTDYVMLSRNYNSAIFLVFSSNLVLSVMFI